MAEITESREERVKKSADGDIQNEVRYDLTGFSAPVVSGAAAHVLLAASEVPFIGTFLKRKILRDSGFSDFYHRTEKSSNSLRYAIHFPLPESPETPLAYSVLDFFFDAMWLDSVKKNVTDKPSKRSTVQEYVTAYRERTVSPIHVCEAVLELIEASNRGALPLKAVISSDKDAARLAAKESAERWKSGHPLSILDGVPFLVKDMIHAHDGPFGTTGGVGPLVLTPPPKDFKDAEVVAALRSAGMIMVGKTHTTEIGMGVRGYTQSMGQARNPWDLGRVPGGSSSGSAAAVAAGLAPITLGSDGGGSIRIPAACCGVFGLKPTYARLSIQGSFLETARMENASDGEDPVAVDLPKTVSFGPLALTADDLTIAYLVLASYAPHGRIEGVPDFTGGLIEPLPKKVYGDIVGLRVGIYQPFADHASDTAKVHFRRAVAALERAGAQICPVVIPQLEDIKCAHGIAISSHTYKTLKKSGLTAPEKWRLIGMDTRLKMAAASLFDEEYIAKADTMRAHAVKEITVNLFQEVDIVLTPSLGCDVPAVAKNLQTGDLDAGTDSALMRFMTFANFTGVPAVSVPVGVDEKSGMPFSVQAIAGPWKEVVLLQVAKCLENHMPVRHDPPAMAFDILEAAAMIKSRMDEAGENL